MSGTKVFHDPTNRRKKLVHRSLFSLASVSFLALMVFVVSIFFVGYQVTTLTKQQGSPLLSQENLPSLLPSRPRQRTFRGTKQHLLRFISSHAASTPSPTNIGKKPLSSAFVVTDDPKSMASLRENADKLDMVYPDLISLQGPDLTQVTYTPNAQVSALAEQYHLKVMPFVNNYADDAWQSERLSIMLRSKPKRTQLITSLISVLHDNQLAGINIDFESIHASDQPFLLTFLQELHLAAQTKGLLVSQDVPFTDDNFPLQKLATATDYLVVMMYDEHSGTDAPGSIAGTPWLQSNIDTITHLVPSEKLIIGIGNYGREWDEHGKVVADRSTDEVMAQAALSHAAIQFDSTSLNPWFQFQTATGAHTIWFLDAITAYNHIQVSSSSTPAGFALWRLGEEDPSIWSIYGKHAATGSDALSALKQISAPPSISFTGSGDILSVIQKAEPGNRDLTATGSLITSETYRSLATPFVIQKYGDLDHKVVLTFDDGPSAEYTKPILDILKTKHAPATFFVMGDNAEKNLPLLHQIASDGHEIGNHTFTHPNITKIEPQQMMLELNATERLIESQLFLKSTLFRAPYDVDTDPSTMAQVVPLSQAKDLGYITIGASIDSNDWQKPGVDKIVSNVMTGLEQHHGGIILLHDAGGDRTQTIQTLPTLIDTLRSKGYEITTIAKVLGKQKQEILIPMSPQETAISFINTLLFWFWFLFQRILYYSFFLIIGMSLFRLVVLGILAARYKRHASEKTDFSPFVSILVPVHNEAAVVEKTLTSLVNSQYTNMEVIVIDDGSTDATAAIVEGYAMHHSNVQLIRQSNQGKTASLNTGLAAAQGKIVITIDGDTLFTPHTVSALVAPFANERVGAVAGQIVVGNIVNLLTLWQAVEYITSQNFDRRAYDTMNCITVVPGATGAFRRSALEAIGNFSDDTWAEDSDMTISLIHHGWNVVYADKAVARTEAPEKVRDLLKQRVRWSLGTMQNTFKYKRLLFNPRTGLLGLFALPNLLIFGIIIPLLGPLLDLQFFLILISGASRHLIVFYVLFVVLDMVVGIQAFRYTKQPLWMLIALPLQRFVYRQLMYIALFKAFFIALRGSDARWNKLQRSGNVIEP